MWLYAEPNSGFSLRCFSLHKKKFVPFNLFTKNSFNLFKDIKEGIILK